MRTVVALVFDNFETLDLFGPVEVFGRLPESFQIQYVSLAGGIVSNQHGVKLETIPIEELSDTIDILLVIGGQGTRALVKNVAFCNKLKALSQCATWVLSVCTGSALLARTGELDNIKATSNKRAWQWVIEQSSTVNWIPKARWVKDNKFYTSSGVSAGIDMTFAFISEQLGYDSARGIADEIEYRWNENSLQDEFYERWQSE